jgi:hypothetical protein
MLILPNHLLNKVKLDNCLKQWLDLSWNGRVEFDMKKKDRHLPCGYKTIPHRLHSLGRVKEVKVVMADNYCKSDSPSTSCRLPKTSPRESEQGL